MIPGFIEGHGHFTGVGEAQLNLNLMKTSSWDEIVAMVAEAAKKREARASGSSAAAGTRRSGRGAGPNVEGFPTHASLERVSPDNPVLLTHASGHASFANAKAMELAGITADHAEPAGRRDPEGRDGQSDRPPARDGAG